LGNDSPAIAEPFSQSLSQKLLPPQPISGFSSIFLTDPSFLLFEVPGVLTFLIKYGSGKSGGLEKNSPGQAEIV
jgi:hypothetical protein